MPNPGYGPNGIKLKPNAAVTWSGAAPAVEHPDRTEAPQIYPFGLGTIPQLNLETEVIRVKEEGGNF